MPGKEEQMRTKIALNIMDHKEIAFSILELAIVSQGETIQQTLHNSLALAREAEAHNYKRIWFA
jgi:hypothetical protein